MTITTLLHVSQKALPMLLAIALSACGSHSSPESVASEPVESRCGDGRIDLGEECDGADFGGKSCGSFRRDAGGLLTCNDDCQLNLSLCTDATCGNGRLDASVDTARELCELCDGGDVGARSCRAFGGTGDLQCTTGCTLARASCDGVCLNGRLEPAESCDVDPATYAAIVPDGLSCESLGLGHGELYCGLGGGSLNTPFGTTVFTGCQVSTYDCDRAAALGTFGRCGDGIRTDAEYCDGSDFGGLTCERLGLTGSLACTPSCELDFTSCAVADGPAQCGDGLIEAGEECDGNHFAPLSNGPTDRTDADLLSCEIEAMYDGHDLCTADCRIDRSRCHPFNGNGTCGDGVAQLYEECDGNDLRGRTCADLGGSGDLGCTPYCALDRSGCRDIGGNGKREDDEVCDVSVNPPGPLFAFSTDVGNATCEALGYGGGNLRCTVIQRSWRSRQPYWIQDPVFLTRFATYDCQRQGICGDGRATDGEQCDGEDLAGTSCATFDAEGELRCNPSCAFDLSGCRSTGRCGDGRVSFGEECEPGLLPASCAADGGTGAYTCDPESCFIDATGCSFACTR